MISFLASIIALIVGYLIYGKFIERIVAPTSKPTPAITMADGVDYIALPGWKVFMIQFLNIAGTGPIFGAIMGAWYGPMAYLWIVFGCIFAGAVHDYLCGMLSLRHGGVGLPELVGLYLGKGMKGIVLFFSVFLLLMVGVVFVFSPALILSSFGGSTIMWVFAIFLYYVIATILPIDKVIARFYPIFAFSLLFMAGALFVYMLIHMPALPELWTSMADYDKADASLLRADSFIAKNPVFPCLFITIACGAVSGFHATQSPLMARCMTDERQGRPIFYGAMITEGIVALVWATASMYFFYYGGWREVVPEDTVNAFMAQLNEPGGKSLLQYFPAPDVVNRLCTGWLGVVGGVLAILGVVAAPITSGDTALRSARLIIAEALGVKQGKVRNRMIICLPMFAACIGLLIWQIANPNGFNTIWQYFGWSNQTLAALALWTITVYLYRQKKNFYITLLPALFMTTVVVTFFFVSIV